MTKVRHNPVLWQSFRLPAVQIDHQNHRRRPARGCIKNAHAARFDQAIDGCRTTCNQHIFLHRQRNTVIGDKVGTECHQVKCQTRFAFAGRTGDQHRTPGMADRRGMNDLGCLTHVVSGQPGPRD